MRAMDISERVFSAAQYGTPPSVKTVIYEREGDGTRTRVYVQVQPAYVIEDAFGL